MTRAEHLAVAFFKVAQANHYMVGIVIAYTVEEILDAEQILITQSNAANNTDEVIELALDLIENAKRELKVY